MDDKQLDEMWRGIKASVVVGLITGLLALGRVGWELAIAVAIHATVASVLVLEYRLLGFKDCVIKWGTSAVFVVIVLVFMAVYEHGLDHFFLWWYGAP